MAEPGTLESQIGIYDNLDDATPLWNRPSTIIALTLVFCGITLTCVSLRLYARFYLLKMPGWDDYVMLSIMFFGGIGTITMCILPIIGGLGQHYLELSEHMQMMHFKLFYVSDGSFVTTVSLVKLALLFQYTRLFDSGPHRYLCIIVLAFVGLWGATTSFMAWFPCFPPGDYWDPKSNHKSCYGYGSPYVDGRYATFLAHSIVNMCLDIIILALPLPLLFRLSTQPRTRLGVAGLLAIGLLTNAIAALRLVETIQHKAMAHPTFDPPWYGPKLCLLGMLEVNFASIGASVPIFWPVFRDKLGAIFVTREINVSVVQRSSDDLRLQRSESLYSNDNSERTLQLWRDREGGITTDKGSHYKDTYVMDQVDPLRKKTTATVDSKITAGDDANPKYSIKSTSQGSSINL